MAPATVALLQCNGEDASTESSYLANRAGEIVTQVASVVRNSTVTVFQANVADSNCRVAGSPYRSYEAVAENCHPTSDPVKCTILYYFGNPLLSEVKCESRVPLVTLKKEQQLGKFVEYDGTNPKVIEKVQEAVFDFDQREKSKKYRKLKRQTVKQFHIHLKHIRVCRKGVMERE
ncbi:Altered inheritance of mitochondria protein 9 [Trichinella spiralis]|uniref:Altered inheritance of mitochondria protein 9 n=1 Tax=Trichinella spiralis TaxID=6334 RepID=A0ABR3KST7_TRISP